MPASRRAWCALVVLLALSTPRAWGTPASRWEPARTWVFAVGVLEWQDARTYSPFPKERRRDRMLVTLLQACGVPKSQVVFIEDRAATHGRIAASFGPFLDRTRPGDLLIVYYAGHGWQEKDGTTYFAPYDAGDDMERTAWSLPSLFATVRGHFRGSRVLLLADCCYSGALAPLARRHASATISYAVLASSLASSASTGAWTFTEAVLDGLRGRPGVDENHDGVITLREMARYVEAEMAFGDEQLATFEALGCFGPATVMAVVQGKPPHGRVGERLEVESEGQWWRGKVLDQARGRYRVHFYGWDESFDEWVESARVRRLRPVVHPVGTHVQVEWKGQWYPAVVRETRQGIHLVHYDGYDDVWNEWVGAHRIRSSASAEPARLHRPGR